MWQGIYKLFSKVNNLTTNYNVVYVILGPLLSRVPWQLAITFHLCDERIPVEKERHTVWPENLAGIIFGGSAVKGCEMHLAD